MKTMTRLRVFNKLGTEEFGKYLEELRNGSVAAKPDLNSDEFSDLYPLFCEIDESRNFENKLELAGYLQETFTRHKIERSEILGNGGLWTWLSYTWISQLTPDVKGKRKVGGDERHIYTDNPTRRYRHLVATPYVIYTTYGSHDSRFILFGEIHREGDYLEQLASTRFIISSPGVIKTATKLYWDETSETPKRGVQTRTRPGSLRRFVRVLGQLDLTYDVAAMTADELLDLLPREFSAWK